MTNAKNEDEQESQSKSHPEGSPHEFSKKCVSHLLAISTQKQTPSRNKGLLGKA